MTYLNFEDFEKQANAQGIYEFTAVVIEWLNQMNMTYPVFEEMVRRYSALTPGQRELFKLPFAPQEL